MIAGFLLAFLGLFKGSLNPSDSSLTKKITIGAYLDTYYGSSLYSAERKSRAYFVSSANNNHAQINLLFFDLRYKSDLIRFHIAPGTGTYMQANYAAEKKEFHKYIFEANAGIRISKSMNTWIDAGILDSPFSSEGPVSRDQLLYSRSFAPEYVPYYLNGIRLTISPSPVWELKFYRLNGWQQISDVNSTGSFASNIIIKPGNSTEITYNTYFGNEGSPENPEFTNRQFHDFYIKHAKVNRWETIAGFYLGNQKRISGNSSRWWQINLMGRKILNNRFSLSGRLEYFHDPERVMIRPARDLQFKTFSTGTTINIKISEKALFRIDGRYFYASEKIFEHSNKASNKDVVLMTSLTLWH